MRATSGTRLIEELSRLSRGSCSPGEREAAERIAERLTGCGFRVELEDESVAGTYWWPLGLTSGLGLVSALLAGRGHRRLAAAAGALGAALAADDVTVGRRIVRGLLPHRMTTNVVARLGDSSATRTLVLVAHHDAAHSGFFFDPRITHWMARHRGDGAATRRGVPPVMAPVVVGPALAALGARSRARPLRALGAMVCAGIIASFTDIARRSPVPGANDNLTGVATLLDVAEALDGAPPPGMQVILVSTGAEEALMDGMAAFVARHADELRASTAHVLCVDTVGSPHLVLAEGEGMLRVRPYDSGFKALIARCAAEGGIALRRGMEMHLGTDGYLALRAGLPAAMLMSVDDDGLASNYHWPSDTPGNVDEGTLHDCVALCLRVIRAFADDPAPPEPSTESATA